MVTIEITSDIIQAAFSLTKIRPHPNGKYYYKQRKGCDPISLALNLQTEYLGWHISRSSCPSSSIAKNEGHDIILLLPKEAALFYTYWKIALSYPKENSLNKQNFVVFADDVDLPGPIYFELPEEYVYKHQNAQQLERERIQEQAREILEARYDNSSWNQTEEMAQLTHRSM